MAHIPAVKANGLSFLRSILPSLVSGFSLGP